jgi:hypothetical protein
MVIDNVRSAIDELDDYEFPQIYVEKWNDIDDEVDELGNLATDVDDYDIADDDVAIIPVMLTTIDDDDDEILDVH